MPGEILGDFAKQAPLHLLVVVFAQLAERPRRCDDDQGIEFVAQGARPQHLRRFRSKAIFFQLVEIRLRISMVAGAGAGDRPSCLVGLLIARGRIGLLLLAIDLELREPVIALIAEEKHLLAVGDENEAVVRYLHVSLRLSKRPINVLSPARLPPFALGVNAAGLSVLEKIAGVFSDDIWTVAPSEERSGSGHSLTITTPVRLRQLGERRFCVAGTPTDSVMMAIAHLMKDSPPDLILSGVNRGANLAEDVTYSGTVSAAMEGALAGIPSIALSQVYSREGMGDSVPFATAEAWAERVLRPLIATPIKPRTLVNINFPALPSEEVKGIRIVRQGLRDYGRLRIDHRTDPRGYEYFWFGLGTMIHTPGHTTDLEAIADGYISVTPLHLDMTHDTSLDRLRVLYR